ncbi:VCBS repeat-containing protein [Shewanella sp. NKUCC05_KAH]|uniref:RHS repeat-associated core domain-containing protein n=1 Tax=Shewanella sp. NKUCC05_KAH TaxID=2842126 RepID=UPI001C5AE0C7|nr:RHS repeat-associated core domain-containing protein [Shewanella sp. NKUCC05_KAH]MBW3527067.1 VCBS repeat-containing protein [Shewanella sp. NKUCC05_KAH]
MSPLLTTLRYRPLFTVFILLLGFAWGAPSKAALVPSTPVLSGNKSNSMIDLHWYIGCEITSANIQESTDNVSWSTVYTGLGNADGGSSSMLMARAVVIGDGSGTVCSGWTNARYINLSGKTLSGYYYRINACQGTSCSGYSSSLLVGTPSIPTTPSPPTSISVPVTNATGAFNVTWSSVSGAIRYELQQRVNGGAWVAKYSGTATNFALSGLASGTYQYQVRACSTACSTWKLSSNTQVTLPVLGSDWKNLSRVTVADAGGVDTVPAEAADLNTATVKGQAGVSGGQASYHIPIDLPPGRNGVQPSVSLSYNSQSGSGILGVGWSLNAGSSISRCGATFAQDAYTPASRAVTFNASTDRLCLDGQRLIATAGSYGASNAEYRTEMDSFVKVVQHGNINDSNSSFTVYKPDGSSATYGASANSRFVPNGLIAPLSWKVSQELYSNGANTIDYVYDASMAGEHLLSNIFYTGNLGLKGNRQVDFLYESRSDSERNFLMSGKIAKTRRVNKIDVYKDESSLVSSYELNYIESGASKRSLLQSVTQCSLNNWSRYCTPLTTFNWAASPMSFRLEPLGFGSGMAYPNIKELSEVLPKGDINGDGVADWKSIFVNAEGEHTGTHSTTLNPCYKSRYSLSAPDCISIDMNNDGLTDDWRSVNGALEIKLTNGVWQSTGISLDASNKYSLESSRIINAADYNGDGWQDLMIYHHNSGSPILKLYLNSKNPNTPYSNNGNTVFIYPTFATSPTDTVLLKQISFVGDFTGDGLPDLLVNPTPVGMNAWFNSAPKEVLVNNTASNGVVTFTAHPLNFGVVDDLVAPSFNYFFDVNGDGLADWLGWQEASDSIGIAVRLNLGNLNFGPKQIAQGVTLPSRLEYGQDPISPDEQISRSSPKYLGAFKSADINFDGKPELIVPGRRIYEGCFSIVINGTSKRTCGDALYGANAYGQELRAIPSYYYDDSIYQFDAISFTVNAAGQIVSKQTPTQMYGHAYQSTIIDAFGNGLPSMLFVHRTQPGSSFNRNASGSPFSGYESQHGVFISRNFGSDNGFLNSNYKSVDYLESVTDGLGNSSEWRYRPLSTGEGSADQAKLYTTDFDEVGTGYVHFASSMYVVQSFKQSNGQGGENETQYAYKGAMYNLQGRGFTGFNQIWEKDMQRDKTVHSVFKQKFPEVGLLTEQTVSVGSTTVNQVTNTWADNTQHSINKVFHNIQTRSLQQSWDLQGTPLSTQDVQVSASDVDAWGNIKKQTQKVTDYMKGQANTYTSVTETSYAADINNWWLNKFNSIKTSHNTAQRNWGDDPVGTMDKAQWQLQTVNTWNEVHKLPTKVTYTASNSSCNRVEETGLNSYGLPLWTKTTGQSSTCSAMAAKQTNFTYTKDGNTQADDGYLPYKVTNAKGHISTTEYDMGLGLATKVTAPNGIVSQTQYDGIGRPVQVQQTGSPTRYLRYLLADEGNNPPQDNDNLPVVMTRTSGAGMPETEQYFDGQGRLLRTATQGFDGGYQYQDKHYDALGRLTRESTPYGNGTAADYTEFSDFDALDRPGRRTIPNGRSGGLESLYSYNGLTTDINVEGRLMSRTYGSQGWLYETVDAQNGTNRFAYDSAGRPLVIRDANNSDIKATYNGFGHKTQVIDPNQGTTVFGYNTLGELDKQTDANGVVQTYVLDVLGRVTSKTTIGGHAPGTATFVWDTLKQGLLTSETENGVARTYAYTTALQLAQTTVTVDGVSRTIKHQYDGFYGRPKALEYPNGLTLKYAYNDYGYLEQTSNAASGYLYRQITAMDEAGHITGADLGNRVMSESRSYYSEGTMASIEVDGPLGRIHAHYYDGYDDFMNLTSERDGVTGLTKSYRYDTLNRLTEYQFSNTNPTFSATVNYAYDKVGNFLKKTDYSANSTTAYRYGGSASCVAGNNAGPNAVCQLTKLNGTTVSFQYDKRGNLRVGDGLTMTYNAMDKPLSVSGRGATTSFVYGSDNMRAKQSRTVGSTTTTTYYVDKYYEADSDGSWRAYLDDIAVLSYTPTRSHLLQFTLKDRLGSATTLADQNGNIVSQRYFDPFGRTTDLGINHKLDIQNKNTTLSQLQDLAVTNKNRRGFTDHEHLNEQQLIHMNGRIYDYNLGRFMSVDPFIQSPTSTQSVNPYSYIMNNPLAGTDPTGYACEAATGTRICSKDVGDIKVKDVSKVTITKNDNGSAKISVTMNNGSVRSQNFNLSSAGGLGDIASKQSYGNDPNFAKGYGSAKGDMSGILSLTPLGQTVDSIKSGIEGVETAINEYNETGSVAGAVMAGGVLALEKYAERKLKIGRGPDVVNNKQAPNMSPPGAGRSGALNEAKRQSGVPTSRQPSRTLPNTDKRGNPQPGRIYEYEVPAPGGGTRTIRIRDDAGGHNYGPSDPQNRGPHFNDEAKNHYDY